MCKKKLQVSLAIVVLTIASPFPTASAFVRVDSEEAKLTASDGSEEGEFGAAVAVSGETTVVGSTNWRFGGAYVFTVPEPLAGLLHSTALATLVWIARCARRRRAVRPRWG